MRRGRGGEGRRGRGTPQGKKKCREETVVVVEGRKSLMWLRCPSCRFGSSATYLSRWVTLCYPPPALRLHLIMGPITGWDCHCLTVQSTLGRFRCLFPLRLCGFAAVLLERQGLRFEGGFCKAFRGWCSAAVTVKEIAATGMVNFTGIATQTGFCCYTNMNGERFVKCKVSQFF